jgi:hypothetical protein
MSGSRCQLVCSLFGDVFLISMWFHFADARVLANRTSQRMSESGDESHTGSGGDPSTAPPAPQRRIVVISSDDDTLSDSSPFPADVRTTVAPSIPKSSTRTNDTVRNYTLQIATLTSERDRKVEERDACEAQYRDAEGLAAHAGKHVDKCAAALSQAVYAVEKEDARKAKVWMRFEKLKAEVERTREKQGDKTGAHAEREAYGKWRDERRKLKEAVSECDVALKEMDKRLDHAEKAEAEAKHAHVKARKERDNAEAERHAAKNGIREATAQLEQITAELEEIIKLRQSKSLFSEQNSFFDLALQVPYGPMHLALRPLRNDVFLRWHVKVIRFPQIYFPHLSRCSFSFFLFQSQMYLRMIRKI